MGRGAHCESQLGGVDGARRDQRYEISAATERTLAGVEYLPDLFSPTQFGLPPNPGTRCRLGYGCRETAR